MQEAYGGIMNLVIISIFLVIIIGIFGFIVSYAKAFKMKNNVIHTIEQYEGSGCFKTGSNDTACLKSIKEGADRIGYSANYTSCPSGYTSINGLFCVSPMKTVENASSSSSTNPHNKKVTYTISTQVDIGFPIVKNIMGFKLFRVYGDTGIIECPGNC